METNRPHITPQGVVGVFIVLLGIVFTLDNLGLVESHEILRYWPLAPIGVGLLIVIHAQQARDWIRGCVWLTGGSLFLAQNMGYLRIRVEALWPLLLVAFGLHIIFRSQESSANMIERRAKRVERQQQRWQRKAERWRQRHGDTPPPWNADWAAQWQQKWHQKQEDWQAKVHGDWQDKLKHTIQSFAGTPPDVDVKAPIDVNVGVGTPGAADAAGAPPGAAPLGTDPNQPGQGPIPNPNPNPAANPPRGGTYTPPSSAWSPHPNRISMFALMGSVTRRVVGVPFTGATLTAVMGGVELDLHQAALPDDAVIELFAFWGGIEIFVPRDWVVVNQGFTLMGAVEDKTGNVPRPGGPRLIIRGMALMGGVEIKN
jgi:hypothetical protein